MRYRGIIVHSSTVTEIRIKGKTVVAVETPRYSCEELRQHVDNVLQSMVDKGVAADIPQAVRLAKEHLYPWVM